MNANNKKRMLDAVMRYGTEGKPVKQAMNDYNTWLDNLNNIRVQDPSAIIGNGNLSVYDFFGGKKPTIKYLNGDKIE
jgi:hypothetical protein